MTTVTVKAVATTRLAALDFTKGMLVLLMVLYHWLNYFVADQGDFYRYLRFVTPSFIFITGFLISNIYLSKYDLNDSGLAKRLAQRGVKLLAVFVALNLIISHLVRKTYNGQAIGGDWSWDNLSAIYVTGNTAVGTGKVAAFYILVPISYLLLVAALLLALSRYRYIFLYSTVLFLGIVFGLEWYGIKIPNLELLTIGLLGVSVGYMPLARINALSKYPLIVILAYIGNVAAITMWNAIYPLQIVGVGMNVLVIYLWGTTGSDNETLRKPVILIGKYSLIGYIAQIVVLQILYKASHALQLGVIWRVACFFAAIVLTILTVEILHRLREKSPVVDGLYRAIFA
jgi:peptidoglycan/LPS O-acetylase OafA/YrhL